MENLELADMNARRGKRYFRGVRLHDKDAAENLMRLHKDLTEGTYRTATYKSMRKVTDAGKERLIHVLPYFPDRICHHAIMQVLEPVFYANFIRDTYACVRGRGIHDGVRRIRRALRDTEGTRYCLKVDVGKFYESIDQDVLVDMLRRKFKEPKLMALLEEIVRSTDKGLPIGNYVSQFFANFYLSDLDHAMKEREGVRYYFRYCDDIVILHHDKARLHALLTVMKDTLSGIRLRLKPNHRVFPVSEGIDFLGYVFFHTHTRLRKSIKKKMFGSLSKASGYRQVRHQLDAYRGWTLHADCSNLYRTYNEAIMKKFSELGIDQDVHGMVGEKIKLAQILNREIIVHAAEIGESKYKDNGGKEYCLKLQIELNGTKRVLFTSGKNLVAAIRAIPEDGYPFTTTIIEDNNYVRFT